MSGSTGAAPIGGTAERTKTVAARISTVLWELTTRLDAQLCRGLDEILADEGAIGTILALPGALRKPLSGTNPLLTRRTS